MIANPTSWTEMLSAYGFDVRYLGDRGHGRRVGQLTVKDIKRVIYAVEGEAEGEDWLMLCELQSGEFMHLFANCAYTGFDVGGHVYCFVSQSVQKLRSGGIRDIDTLRYILNKRIIPQVQELVDAVRSRA